MNKIIKPGELRSPAEELLLRATREAGAPGSVGERIKWQLEQTEQKKMLRKKETQIHHVGRGF